FRDRGGAASGELEIARQPVKRDRRGQRRWRAPTSPCCRLAIHEESLSGPPPCPKPDDPTAAAVLQPHPVSRNHAPQEMLPSSPIVPTALQSALWADICRWSLSLPRVR